MAPGLEKMMEYSKMERLSARLPPPADVLKAITDYLAYKRDNDTPHREKVIPDIQAHHLLRCLKYLDQTIDLSTLTTFLLRPWMTNLDHPSHKDSVVQPWTRKISPSISKPCVL